MLPWWVETDAEHHLLALREILVRCDENLKANTLLQECVPYCLEEDHPLVDQARGQQAKMVEHITGGPAAYAAYYSHNEHERPFEEQYGVEASQAHEGIPRLAILREELKKPRLVAADGQLLTLLDLSCNDGWMAANLRKLVQYHGIDLNPDCIDRACKRNVPGSRFLVGDIHDAAALTADARPADGYDVVVCFECLEHVPYPEQTLAAVFSVLKPGGRAFLSTPAGAVEQGNLREWWKVESKGHVRVFTPRTFAALLEPWGKVEMALGADQVLVAKVDAPTSHVGAAQKPG